MSRRRVHFLVRAPRVPPRLAGLAVDADRRASGGATRRGRVWRSSRLPSSCISSRCRWSASFAAIEPDTDRGTLVVITGCALLAWSLMMSQAMESVTRAFYARSDLDLILSSPVAARRSSRCGSARWRCSTVLMAVLLAAPVHQRAGLARRRALARRLRRGGRDRRSRGRDVGCAHGRAVPRHRPEAARGSPPRSSPRSSARPSSSACRSPPSCPTARCPISRSCNRRRSSRYVPGDGQLRLVAGARDRSATCTRSPPWSRSASLLLGARDCVFSTRFGEHAMAAAGISDAGARQKPCVRRFRRRRREHAAAQGMDAARAATRGSLSQTLMQLLYLLPPALMLWRAFGDNSNDARAAGPGAGDGGGPARGRPRVARHFGRGRARPGGHRAGPGSASSSTPRSRR